jgi:tetratricopeptide (TPR) repeat protein
LDLVEIDYDEAAYQLSERALKIISERFGPESLEMVDCLEMKGLAKYFWNRENDRAEAAVLFERALEILRRHVRPDHPRIATLYLRLANACRYTERLDEMDTLISAAIRIREAEFGPDHPETGEIYYYAGLSYQFGLQDLPRAEQAYEHALDIRRQVLDSLHPHFGKTAHRLGHTRYKAGDYAGAAKELQVGRPGTAGGGGH